MDITQLIECIMGEICDDYCKYLEKTNAGEITEDEMADICEKCPFFRDYTEKRERKTT